MLIEGPKARHKARTQSVAVVSVCPVQDTMKARLGVRRRVAAKLGQQYLRNREAERCVRGTTRTRQAQLWLEDGAGCLLLQATARAAGTGATRDSRRPVGRAEDELRRGLHVAREAAQRHLDHAAVPAEGGVEVVVVVAHVEHDHVRLEAVRVGTPPVETWAASHARGPRNEVVDLDSRSVLPSGPCGLVAGFRRRGLVR
eukprot:scaffold17214_cov38-Phaeocystis_antarctica.AAC.1